MQKPIRVVIVDDHQVFVDALAVRLSDDPDFDVVGRATTSEQALAVLAATPCDVVTLDLALAGEDGLALGAEILRRWPSTGVVVVTGLDGGGQVLEAVQLGVRGWVSKVGTIDALTTALRGVARGETHIPAALLTQVLVSLSGQPQATVSEAEGIRSLTQRELDVLGCLVEGMSRNEIGELLHVSPNTVRTHVQSILHKLKVHSALAAVAIARRAGVTGSSSIQARVG
ncbi:MAG TPA: response regulator transcription factor [Pedococcus sp.]|jgi:DNA-binding NarL/FixJ family response regulator|uniref:response regulator transcription factor n=1 Tax=Pedococcus sp. TaxID=2860345 RepID=UPI002F942197